MKSLFDEENDSPLKAPRDMSSSSSSDSSQEILSSEDMEKLNHPFQLTTHSVLGTFADL